VTGARPTQLDRCQQERHMSAQAVNATRASWSIDAAALLARQQQCLLQPDSWSPVSEGFVGDPWLSITLILCHILHSISHWPVLEYFIITCQLFCWYAQVMDATSCTSCQNPPFLAGTRSTACEQKHLQVGPCHSNTLPDPDTGDIRVHEQHNDT
jgi:hypothetical protein